MEKAVPAFWYSIILEVWSFYLSEVLGVQVFETPKKNKRFTIETVTFTYACVSGG